MELELLKPGTGAAPTTLRIKGEMDIGEGGVDALREALDRIIEEGARQVVIDLSDASYIISRGFGQMLVALARLRTRQGDLRIAGARGSVWTAARTVGLDNIIRFYPTLDEAVSSFRT